MLVYGLPGAKEQTVWATRVNMLHLTWSGEEHAGQVKPR